MSGQRAKNFQGMCADVSVSLPDTRTAGTRLEGMLGYVGALTDAEPTEQEPGYSLGTQKNRPQLIEIAAYKMVRRGGLEPPRCYPLAPQASASANSAISAKPQTVLLLGRRLLLSRPSAWRSRYIQRHRASLTRIRISQCHRGLSGFRRTRARGDRDGRARNVGGQCRRRAPGRLRRGWSRMLVQNRIADAARLSCGQNRKGHGSDHEQYC
jgi:hypothetical protein